MNDADIEKPIIEACDNYIKKFTEILKYEIHINQIPEKTIPFTVMEPSSKSSHSGVNYTLIEPDIDSIACCIIKRDGIANRIPRSCRKNSPELQRIIEGAEIKIITL